MSVFTEAADRYGPDNVTGAMAIVDWYTGTLYLQLMGRPHEEMPRGKVLSFATKILDFMIATDITWEQMKDVFRQAVNTGRDPTIYLVTNPKVMGYQLLNHPDIGWETLAGTIYQPVDDYY